MCGICGIFNPNGLDDADRGAINAMTAVLKHRGPDDGGVRIESHVALGHRRLSIVDIEGGAQPMSNEDGTIWTTFNGEIYNFQDLAADLRKRGHEMRTRSDTEVIPHAYESYGPDFVRKLRGMFALAVWDSTNRTLLIARDRVGKKPLYYAHVAGRFIFGSEIKSIIQHPAVERRLDILSLHHSFSFQHVPGADTIFMGIRKLMPAHLLVVGEGEERQHRYWFPERIKQEKKYIARKDSNALFETIKGAVRERLMGDVPVGAFLSGGIDSSAVVGLMTQCMDEPPLTFSIGFDEPTHNETDFSRMVARHFRTNHSEFIIRSDELMDCVPSIIWNCDEPVADSSILPTFCLSLLTRQHVKVALSGDGGDELFGGYERYVADRYLHYYNVIPESVRRNMMTPLLSFASHSAAAEGSAQQRLEQMATFSPMSDAERHLNWLSFFTHHEKMSLFSREIARALRQYNSGDRMQAVYNFADGKGRGFTDQQLLVDFLTYLPETLMMKVDRASMAHGLEVRCPLLAKEVVELAMSVPAGLKIKATTTKRLLKQTFWNFLPAEILYRRKQGFEVPLGAWFRGPLREPLRDLITGQTAKQRELFSQHYIERLLHEHDEGFKDHGHKLWMLLNVELWHRTFMDGAPPTGPRALL